MAIVSVNIKERVLGELIEVKTEIFLFNKRYRGVSWGFEGGTDMWSSGIRKIVFIINV